MKAIQTKFLGPTNTRPARIKASAEGVKPVTYSCDSLADPLRTVHQEAARRFAFHNDWSTDLVSGGLPDGSWVHCFSPHTKVAAAAVDIAGLRSPSVEKLLRGYGFNYEADKVKALVDAI